MKRGGEKEVERKNMFGQTPLSSLLPSLSLPPSLPPSLLTSKHTCIRIGRPLFIIMGCGSSSTAGGKDNGNEEDFRFRAIADKYEHISQVQDLLRKGG